MTLWRFAEPLSWLAYTIGQGRSESRRHDCSLIAGCVSAILAVSVALAYATPPDPPWIPGIYDERDYDDVVGLLTDGTGVTDSQAMPCVECVLVGVVCREGTGWIRYPTVHRKTIRGPPAIETPHAPAELPISSRAQRSRAVEHPSDPSSPSDPTESDASWVSRTSGVTTEHMTVGIACHVKRTRSCEEDLSAGMARALTSR